MLWMREEYIPVHTLRHQVSHHLHNILWVINHGFRDLVGRGWGRPSQWEGCSRPDWKVQAQRVSSRDPGRVCSVLRMQHGQTSALVDADIPATTWAPALWRLTHLWVQSAQLPPNSVSHVCMASTLPTELCLQLLLSHSGTQAGLTPSLCFRESC